MKYLIILLATLYSCSIVPEKVTDEDYEKLNRYEVEFSVADEEELSKSEYTLSNPCSISGGTFKASLAPFSIDPGVNLTVKNLEITEFEVDNSLDLTIDDDFDVTFTGANGDSYKKALDINESQKTVCNVSLVGTDSRRVSGTIECSGLEKSFSGSFEASAKFKCTYR